MRKLVLLPAGLCLVLGWAMTANAQDDEARAIIARAIKAMGGEDKLAKMTASTVKGKGVADTDMGKLTFTLDGAFQLPDKFKVVLNLELNNMAIGVTQVFNGKQGWVNISVGGQNMLMDMDEDTVKESKAMMHVERVTGLIDLKNKGYKFSQLGEMKVEGREAVGLQVTKKGERDVNLWFDKKDHLLVKAEYRARDDMTKQEVNQEKIFSDYKEFNGMKGPAKMVVNNDGKRLLEMEVTEMSFPEKHDDSVFAKP